MILMIFCDFFDSWKMEQLFWKTGFDYYGKVHIVLLKAEYRPLLFPECS